MANRSFIKQMKTQVPFDDLPRIERTAAILFFADEVKKGGFRGDAELERLVKLAFPIILQKISPDAYSPFHGFGTSRAAFMSTELPSKEEIKAMLSGDDFLLQVDNILKRIRQPVSAPIEVEGVLSPPEVRAIRSSLGYLENSSDAISLPAIIEKSDIEKAAALIKKGVENHQPFKEGVQTIVQVVLDEFTREKKEAELALQKLKQENQRLVKEKEKEIAEEEKRYATQLEKELRELKEQIDKENKQSLKDIYARFAPNLNRDLQEISSQLKKALELAKKVSDPDKDFAALEREFNSLAEVTDIFRTTVNSTLHQIRYDMQKTEQNKDTLTVDERSKREHYQALIDHKKAELEPFKEVPRQKELEIENYITALDQKLEQFQTEANAIIDQLKLPESDVERLLIPADAIPGASGSTFTLYIPFYAAVIRKGSGQRVAVLPPFDLPDNLEKIKGARIVAAGGSVGFNPLVENLELLFNKQFTEMLLSNNDLREIVLNQGTNIMEGTPEDQAMLFAGLTTLYGKVKVSKKAKNKVNSFLTEKFRQR